MDGQQHRFEILDNPGFSSIDEMDLLYNWPNPYWHIATAELALLVYDITDRRSFQSVATFAESDLKVCDVTAVALVGTKGDLSIRREVEYKVISDCTRKSYLAYFIVLSVLFKQSG